ncbi:hypothetical protein AWC17_03275 [Mycobacterium nebraskense]|uniref:AB hydrolase-1 domain-containing protein n=1 Tax=Mycobacterium nebraskense TaxID=244292 RepID=A0A1X1ZMQ7_9MYCO|nr:hypothetical protein AWC17_03275 [Mycobacterium nebraskense]
MRLRTRDGVSLRVDDAGQLHPDHTVIFVHGLCLSRRSWSTHIQRLRARYGGAVRIISYDHRGHGDSSSAPVRTYRVEQLADDLACVMTALAISGPCTVVAHSMGAMTVLAYLARPPAQRPVNPGALILVATAAGKLRRRGLGRLLSTPLLPALARAAQHIPDPALRQLLAPACVTLAAIQRCAPAATLPSVVAAALRSTPPATAIGFLADLRSYNHYPTLPAVRSRTVIVSGECDPLTPPSHARDIAAAIPGATHICIPGAGHMLPQQAPAVIDRLIDHAVRAVPNPSPVSTIERKAQ